MTPVPVIFSSAILKKTWPSNYSRVGVKSVAQPYSEGSSQRFLSKREAALSEIPQGFLPGQTYMNIVLNLNDSVEWKSGL